ncbi:MAG: permease [Candidatus Zipacnadales bacterium]
MTFLRENWKKFLIFVGVFLVAYFLPVQHPRVKSALLDAFVMLNDYARKHVLFCLVPAFFIAGAITVFVSQESVLRYLGAKANKVLAYGVASISGTILAVCSCTVLPLFAGIYTRGAGIGPATAFLYSGPAINVLAIILTARVLGWELGLARAVGAVLFSVVVGLLMALFFGKEDETRLGDLDLSADSADGRPLWKTALYMLTMVLILIFAAWAKPDDPNSLWGVVYRYHWYPTLALLVVLILIVKMWFRPAEIMHWTSATWTFAAQILPLLFGGVLVAGLLMGMPGTDNGLIPSSYVAKLVGGNSLFANFFASIVGAFMYFATLTEVPILQGLLGSGMGKGPALALLLAGPALSLPNMLVLRSIMGIKKTLVFVALVVVMATLTGMVFGQLAP